MTSDPLKVLVVDDHELVRTGLRGVLSINEGFDVVAEAGDGVQALAALELHNPDVVVMDLQMAGMGGIEATRRIMERRPTTAVLVVTMFDDDDSVFAAMAAGASGYLLKGADRDELKSAVRSVGLGQVVLGPGVAQKVLRRMEHPTTETRFPELTLREREILELMVAEVGLHEIGRRLGIAEKTVRNNVSSILSKLQVTDRAMAVRAARDAGMTPGFDATQL